MEQAPFYVQFNDAMDVFPELVFIHLEEMEAADHAYWDYLTAIYDQSVAKSPLGSRLHDSDIEVFIRETLGYNTKRIDSCIYADYSEKKREHDDANGPVHIILLARWLAKYREALNGKRLILIPLMMLFPSRESSHQCIMVINPAHGSAYYFNPSDHNTAEDTSIMFFFISFHNQFKKNINIVQCGGAFAPLQAAETGAEFSGMCYVWNLLVAELIKKNPSQPPWKVLKTVYDLPQLDRDMILALYVYSLSRLYGLD
jgi:hypothetical protein